MKRFFLLSLGALLILLFAWPAAAGDEKTSYGFDEVEVVYAAKFDAVPITAVENSWAAELAGGPQEPLTLLYGVVNLIRAGTTINTEEFVKISGSNGSERLLANAYTTRWYNQEDGKYNKLQSSRTLFWSAKQLEGNLLVKDINGWTKAVIVQREFDENGNLTDARLYFTDDGSKDRDLFWDWSKEPQGNYYQAEIDSLQNVGKPTSTKQ